MPVPVRLAELVMRPGLHDHDQGPEAGNGDDAGKADSQPAAYWRTGLRQIQDLEDSRRIRQVAVAQSNHRDD